MFVPKLLKDLLSSLGVEVSKGVEDELSMSSEETDSFTMVVGETDIVAIHPNVRQMGITYSADAAALRLRAEAMGAQGDQKRLYGLAGKRLEKALTVQTNDGRLYWQRANVMTSQEGSTGNTKQLANTHFEIAANLITDPTDRAKMLSDWGWVFGGWVATPTLTAVRIHSFHFPPFLLNPLNYGSFHPCRRDSNRAHPSGRKLLPYLLMCYTIAMHIVSRSRK